MRSKCSSDEWPDCSLLLLLGRGTDGALISLSDLRLPGFSVRMARGALALEEEFELFMQVSITYCEL